MLFVPNGHVDGIINFISQALHVINLYNF